MFRLPAPIALVQLLSEPPEQPAEQSASAQGGEGNECLRPPGTRGGERVPGPSEQRSEAEHLRDPADHPREHNERDSERDEGKAHTTDRCPGDLRREPLDSPLGPPNSADHFVGAVGHLGELLGAEPAHPLFEPREGLLDPLDWSLDSLRQTLIKHLHSVLGELARVDTDVAALTDGLGEVSRG